MTDTSTNAKSITNQLWDMANQLRGNMDPADFQTYILGFMFYRYLSEHQGKYFVDHKLLFVSKDESINDAYKKAATGDDLKSYLEASGRHNGYAIEPDLTWDSIEEKVNNGTIVASDFSDMFECFNKSTQLNKTTEQDFSGVFSDINLMNSRLGSNVNERAKSLSKIVSLVSSFNYNDQNGHDILGDVYEYLIAQFASNSGKKAGEFYTPHEVSEVLAKLVTYGLKPNDEHFDVYDPAMGSGSLLLTVKDALPDGNKKNKVFFHGQELNTTTYNLARMNLMMHGADYHNMKLRNGDTLGSDWPDGVDPKTNIDHPVSVDAVVENPPYSAHWDNDKRKLKDPRFKDYGLAPKGKADYAFLLHGLYHLKQDGTMAIVLPHGVLFRGAKEGDIRKALIKKHNIAAVIGLPEKLFYSTSIPTVVLVLKKQRDDSDILFIDASKDFEKGKNQNKLTPENINKIINTYAERKDVDKYAHLASIDEIEENDFNLNIPRYVDTFEPEPDIDVSAEREAIKDLSAEFDKVYSEVNDMLKDTKTNK